MRDICAFWLKFLGVYWASIPSFRDGAGPQTQIAGMLVNNVGNVWDIYGQRFSECGGTLTDYVHSFDTLG